MYENLDLDISIQLGSQFDEAVCSGAQPFEAVVPLFSYNRDGIVSGCLVPFFFAQGEVPFSC